MKKNVILATGLLTGITSSMMSNESYAINNLESFTQNSRALNQMNKIGKVKGVASNDVLNVRKEPNSNSSLVFTLKNNTEITVIGQDTETNWYKVSYNGNEGYASNRYIEIIGDVIAPSTEKYKVTGAINLRKEANWSSEVITMIKKDETLDVISIDKDWAKVNYKGTVCYAPANYLEKIGSGNTTPSQPVTEKYNVTGAINLRKEANWSSEVVTMIKKDETLDVVSINGDWAKVNYKGTICYAPANYLEKIGSGNTTPSQPVTEKYNVTGAINLRKEANWSSEVITMIKKGETLDVISIDGDWAKVNYKGTACYAPANYLEKVGSSNTTPPESSKPEEQKTMIATVNSNDLNVRAGAGMSYTILAKVNKGDVVLIKENTPTNGWYKVELSNGIVGWCYEDYLENFREGTLPSNPNDSSNDNTNTESGVVSGQIATVNTNDLNIRSGADTIYPILAKVNKGDTVLIKEKDSSGWYKVQLPNGVVGWCNGTYLENFRSGSITVVPGNQTPSSAKELIEKVISVAKAQIGKPYEYGSMGPNSFDCSGLTYYAFKNGADITLPRNSSAQANVGKYVSKDDLQPGDLVFFNTSGSGISHVGIYLGNDEMVHAPSSGKTIQIVKITQSYWASRYVTARRIIY